MVVTLIKFNLVNIMRDRRYHHRTSISNYILNFLFFLFDDNINLILLKNIIDCKQYKLFIIL